MVFERIYFADNEEPRSKLRGMRSPSDSFGMYLPIMRQNTSQVKDRE
jgi:hypothetical protein